MRDLISRMNIAQNHFDNADVLYIDAAIHEQNAARSSAWAYITQSKIGDVCFCYNRDTFNGGALVVSYSRSDSIINYIDYTMQKCISKIKLLVWEFKNKTVKPNYTAAEIAAYIIKYEFYNSRQMSNRRVHSLLYLLQMNELNKTGKVLFNENCYANVFGPTVLPIYYALSFSYGELAKSKFVTENSRCIDEDYKKRIDECLECLSRFTTSELNDICKNNEAYKLALNNSENPNSIVFSAPITVSSMIEHPIEVDKL